VCYAQPEARISVAARMLDPAASSLPRADLRIDVPLVLIPVHVTSPIGVSITGLKKESFRLFEDGVEQKIATFANEDAPVSIGLLFDMSGSMKDKIKKSSDAAIELLKTANPDDEFFLIQFNDRPKLLIPFTKDVDEIRKELACSRPGGQTALLDAIHMGLLQMKDARYSRKALIIVSDGGDNHSRFHETQVKEAMLEADVQVYAMGIFDLSGTMPRSREEREGPRLLNDLAEQTGGRHYPVTSLDDLPTVCARIGEALRNQYLLGYTPANPERDGKYRSVKVLLDSPDPTVRIHNRLGYHAPLE
jgi:Ca-activated chloride channel family protein